MSEQPAVKAPWRIVVLDDNPDDRAHARQLLRRGSERRFIVEEADTAAKGIALIRSGPAPHCVLLDYSLPDAEGGEVLDALRRDDGTTLCPVLILTGADSPELSRDLVRAGAQDFLCKDWLAPALLVRAVENAYERWALTLQLREREARLHEREQELELAFGAARLMYFSWDIPADRVERRMSWLQALPSTDSAEPGPVRLRDVVEVVHPDDRERFEANVGAALSGDGHYASSHRVIGPDGVSWLEEQGKVSFDERGNPLRLAGVSVDTTARRVAEAQQSAATQQQHLLLEVARMVLESPAADAALSRRVFARLAAQLDGDMMLHYQLDKTEEPVLILLASEGLEPPLIAAAQRRAMRQTYCGHVAATRQPLVADWARISHDPAGEFLRQAGVRAYCCHPLFDRGGEALGTFSLGSRRRDAFSAFEVQTLEVACHFLSLAWDRQRADDRARERTAQLQRNHDTFYHLIANNPFGLFVVDDKFRLRQASEGTTRAFGVQSLLGEDFSQVLRLLWQEPYASEVEQRFRNTLATGESYRVEQSLERRNAGQRERLDWRIERIELPDGEFGVVCYYYDLSERHRLEAELRVRERELQSLADNSPDIMVRFDTQLRHVFVNRALEKMTGRPPEHFLGKTCEESLLDPELCELWSSGLSRVLTHGRAEQLEFSLAGPQGQRSYASTLLPELDSGRQVASILAVTHDITDQKRVEQVLQESDRRKDEFLATLAHELRNPLAPLRTGMSVIQDVNAAPALVARAYSIMERQLGHMVRLVDDLLDLSRISRGKIELQRSRVTVQSVIEQAIEISQPLIDAGKHSLIVEVPEKDLWIDGDVTRLAQVVSNLLNNAAKYTPEAGQIGLRVALIGDIIEVHVTDSGTGISPDILPFVFDLFTQSENTRARAQGGLGIGLSLVKRLVEMHGGSVSAYSAGLGRGSSFCVCLAAVAAPAASATASGVSAVATGHSQERPAPAPLRVLVVDDNEDAAEMLATTLKLRGYATSVAFSGPAALDSARSFHPDVVLLDIGLPDMDGHEVARAFRRDEQLRSATLVALTGWGSEQDKAKSRDAGFDFHLVKPADIRSIQEILARAQP